MAVSMGSDLKTMEAFLQSLELESLATVFKENNIDLNLLMGLSDDKLEAKLIEMNLLFGIRSRSKIMDKIKKMKADDLSSKDIKLVASGKDVYIQIGQHNRCQLNINISDELKNEEETRGINDEDNLVNMTLNMHTATSGVYVAVLEERILQSLSVDQTREEINKILLEKFGVEVVACKKGSVVLVLRKMIKIPNCLVDKNVMLEFLSTLFNLLGFSHDYHSEINLRVQLTSRERDTADTEIFNRSQLKKNAGVQLVLSPKKKLKCMTEDKKKELVSYILSYVAGSNFGDKNSNLQLESHFIDQKTHYIKDMTGDPKESRKLTYETYLGLDKLLRCQELESEKAGNRVAEEHLFIIVHQGFEIWFKQILEDFKGVIDILKEPKIEERIHLSGITTKLGRCILILKVVIQHFEIIETMPPAVFLNFRKYLKSGSGFQSLQFRQIENTLGLRPETREQDQPGKDYKDALNTEQSELAKDSEKGDTLFSVAETWLKNVFGTYVRDRVQYFNVLSEMMKTWAEDTTMEEHHRGNKEAFDKILKEDTYETIPDRRLTFEAFHGALLISLYQDEPEFQSAYHTIKLFMDIDSLVSKWRHTHVLMVHRMLGKKTGTGGSSGYDYLKRTNQDKYRVFMEFFNMGAYLIPEEYKKGKKPYSVPESVGGI